MRNLFILFIFALLMGHLQAQVGRSSMWFYASAKAGFGISYLFNENVKNDESVSAHVINPSTVMGGRLGFNYSNDIGLSLEFLSNNMQQKYRIKPEQNATYIKRVDLNYLDFAILFRYSSLSSVYFELGPGLSLINTASAKNSPPYPNDDDLKHLYSGDIIKRAVIGAGLIVFSSYDDRFRFNVGARLNYYLDGIMAEPSDAPNCDNFNNCYYLEERDTYPFTGYILFELDYYFGYYGKAGCGKPRFVMFRNPRRR